MNRSEIRLILSLVLVLLWSLTAWGSEEENRKPQPKHAFEVYRRNLGMGVIDSIKIADRKLYVVSTVYSETLSLSHPRNDHDSYEIYFSVFSLADPLHPKFLGKTTLKSKSEIYAVEDNLVFTGNANTLYAINCATPTSPTLAGTYHGPLGPMVANRTRLYIAAGEEGLKILDFSQPHAIKEIGGYETDEECKDVATSGTLTYLYADDLLVLDAATPTSPSLVSKLTLPKSDLSSMEEFALKKLGAYLFLISRGYENGNDVRASYVNIVDVSQPGTPRLIKERLVAHTDNYRVLPTNTGAGNNSQTTTLDHPQYPGWYLGLGASYNRWKDDVSITRFYEMTDPENPHYIDFIDSDKTYTILYRDLIYLNDYGADELTILKRKASSRSKNP